MPLAGRERLRRLASSLMGTDETARIVYKFWQTMQRSAEIRTILTPDESLLGGDPTIYFRFQQVEGQWALIEHGVVESTNVKFRS